MPLLDLFWTMLIFFLFFIWIWLLISIFADIFRSDDMGGWAKALWVVFVVIVPFLGVLIYLIVRGQSMQQRSIATATKQQQAEQAYIRQTAGAGTGSAADQLAKLAELHDSGALTDAEFESQKAKVLA
ncbi:MAG: SHOCT domain-containing protein [Actinomycetia bacterium]|nr:SHOCT domain-containing protein [Actinomycetes bacterium]